MSTAVDILCYYYFYYGVFVSDKLFISTQLGGELKISNFITCLYRTVLEVSYLFHTDSARNYLFRKKTPAPLKIEWWPSEGLTKNNHGRF